MWMVAAKISINWKSLNALVERLGVIFQEDVAKAGVDEKGSEVCVVHVPQETSIV